VSPVEDLLCGAAAGGVARILCAPLDVIKIRFQVMNEMPSRYQYDSVLSAARSILANEGASGFWKGNIAALMMVVPYASLQFAAFYQLQQSGVAPIAEPHRSLVLGAASGVVATACTYPLDLLRTRFAAQTEPPVYSSLRHAVRTIYRDRGVPGFYAGLQPTLIEIVPYVAIQFATYESARARVLQRSSTGVATPAESLAIGALTGLVAKLATLPLDTAKKRMQVEGQFASASCHAPARQPYSGVYDVLARVYAREGWRGLFRGTVPSLLKAAPNSAVTFAVYEETRSAIARRRLSAGD
jgi:solute carrier family 25 (mitochondrial thiamine pyrophosphate transporter), member 19